MMAAAGVSAASTCSAAPTGLQRAPSSGVSHKALMHLRAKHSLLYDERVFLGG